MSNQERLYLEKFADRIMQDPSRENILIYLKAASKLGKDTALLDNICSMHELQCELLDENSMLYKQAVKDYDSNVHNFFTWVAMSKESYNVYKDFVDFVQDLIDEKLFDNEDKNPYLVELYCDLRDAYDEVAVPF